MMITIHGLPAAWKYYDVKALIKGICNIKEFILDNLVPDENDKFKKVRVGLSDDSEGYQVMKTLNGYQLPGNDATLKVFPVGKTIPQQQSYDGRPFQGQVDNFNAHGNYGRPGGNITMGTAQPNPVQGGWTQTNQPNSWGNPTQPQPAQNNFNYQAHVQPNYQQQYQPAAAGRPTEQPRPQLTNFRYAQKTDPNDKRITIMKDNFQGPAFNMSGQPQATLDRTPTWAPAGQQSKLPPFAKSDNRDYEKRYEDRRPDTYKAYDNMQRDDRRSPPRRPVSPFGRSNRPPSPGRRPSPGRIMNDVRYQSSSLATGRPISPQGRINLPGRPMSNPGRNISDRPNSPLGRRPMSPHDRNRPISGRPNSPTGRNLLGRPISPQGRNIPNSGRPISPRGRNLPPGGPISPQGRTNPMARRPISPHGRNMPPARPISPHGRNITSGSPISPQGQIVPGARPISPFGRRPSPRRISPGKREEISRRPQSDRRMGRPESPRRFSPHKRAASPGRRPDSPNRPRFSPPRHEKPGDKYSNLDLKSKQIRPAYEPQAQNQAMYSGGFRDGPYPRSDDRQWHDRDKAMFSGAMKKDDDRRDARAIPREEKRGPSPGRKSRSPVRRDRSPIRDRFKRHSPSPRSPRRSWALEKRRSPVEAPPPPIWPGQNIREEFSLRPFEKEAPSRFEKDPPSRFEKDPPSRFDKDPLSRFEKDPPSRFDKDPPSRFGKELPLSRFEKEPPSRFEKETLNRFEKEGPSRFEKDVPSRFEKDAPNRFERDRPTRFDKELPPNRFEKEPPSRFEKEAINRPDKATHRPFDTDQKWQPTIKEVSKKPVFEDSRFSGRQFDKEPEGRHPFDKERRSDFEKDTRGRPEFEKEARGRPDFRVRSDFEKDSRSRFEFEKEMRGRADFEKVARGRFDFEKEIRSRHDFEKDVRARPDFEKNIRDRPDFNKERRPLDREEKKPGPVWEPRREDDRSDRKAFEDKRDRTAGDRERRSRFDKPEDRRVESPRHHRERPDRQREDSPSRQLNFVKAFDQEFEDVYNRAVEFRKKTEELRKSSDRRREISSHEDQALRQYTSPEWRTEKKNIPPETQYKREKAVLEIIGRIAEKYPKISGDRQEFTAVLKARLSDLLEEMFGTEDVSFIELVIKYRAKFSDRDENKLVRDILDQMSNKSNLKRNNEESSEVAPKVAKLTPSTSVNEGSRFTRKRVLVSPDRGVGRKRSARDEVHPTKPSIHPSVAASGLKEMAAEKEDRGEKQSDHIDEPKDNFCELGPSILKLLESELDSVMAKVRLALPAQAAGEAGQLVLDSFRGDAGRDFRNALGLNISKRLLNVFNDLCVKVEFIPEINSMYLRTFRRFYGVVASKCTKKRHNETYILQIKNIRKFDQLCYLNGGTYGGVRVMVSRYYPFTKCPPNLKTPFTIKGKPDRGMSVENIETDDVEVTPSREVTDEPSTTAKVANPSTVTNASPKGATDTTKASNISSKPKVTAKPDSTTESNTKEEVESNNAPVKPKAEAKVVLKADAKVTPKIDAKVPPKTEADVNLKTEVKVTPKPETKVTPKTDVKETPNTDTKITTKTDAKPVVKSDPKAAPKANVKSNKVVPKTNVTTPNTTKVDNVIAKPNATPADRKENPNESPKIDVPKAPVKNKVADTTNKITKANVAANNTITQKVIEAKLAPSKNLLAAKSENKEPAKATVSNKQSNIKPAQNTTQGVKKAESDKKPVQPLTTKTKPFTKSVPAKTKKVTNFKQSSKTDKMENDFDELDDHDILALISGGIVLDECSGSDEE